MIAIRTLLAAIVFVCLAPALTAEDKAAGTEKPTQVVERLMKLANASRYTEVTKGIDDGSLKLLGGQDGVVELVDVWTRSGTVAKFSVFRATIEGTKATVWAYIAYEDGTIIPEDKTVLILRDGVWKVRLF